VPQDVVLNRSLKDVALLKDAQTVLLPRISPFSIGVKSRDQKPPYLLSHLAPRVSRVFLFLNFST
jgi:hypothetical protein